MHYHSIIYDVIDEVKRAISGFMAPEIQEKIVGLARSARSIPFLQNWRYRRLYGVRRRCHVVTIQFVYCVITLSCSKGA